MERKKIAGLYVIVGPDATRGRPVVAVAEAALAGGAAMLQYRDKTSDSLNALAVAESLREACSKHGALFFVNDDVALAHASEADGVHLGQDDLPVRHARRILGSGRLIGRSNNSPNEARQSVGMGVDYLALGAVFPTSTVGKESRVDIGLEGIRRARTITDLPIVAIGGIDESNAASVVRAGADSVAVISAVSMADDPEAAARRLTDAIHSAGRRA